MTSINYTSSFCELSNPPKCIDNSTAHDEALIMCFIKRTVLNLSTDRREKSLTNSRGSRVAGPKSRVEGPKSRSRVQCRGRGSKVAVAGPMSRQGKIIWGSR